MRRFDENATRVLGEIKTPAVPIARQSRSSPRRAQQRRIPAHPATVRLTFTAKTAGLG